MRPEPIPICVSDQQSQLRALIEGAATAAVVVDQHGVIRLMSRVAVELFGYEHPDQIVGRRLETLIPPRFREAHREYVAHYFAAAVNRPMGVGRDLTGLRRDGSEFAIEVSLSPIVLDEQLLVAAWVHDAQARRKLEAEVRQYQAQLAHVARVAFASEMVGGIAHELSQPLAAITGYAEAIQMRLAREPELAAEMATLTEPLTEQAVRAGQIVRSLRDFIKDQEPVTETVRLGLIVDRAVRFLDNELRMAGVRMSQNLPADLPPVRAVEIQIAQVLDNLIRNSLEALSAVPADQRRIAIEAAHQDGRVRVTVQDSGPGFSEEAEGQALETFYSTKPGGMGLGLAVCRTIVEAHEGQVRLGRGSLGGGSVSFTLPSA